MDDSPDTASTGFEVTLDDQGTPTLHLEGRMDSGSAPAMINGVISLFTKNPPATLIVDLAKVTYLDDFGALVLVELKNLMPGKENRMVIANAADTVKDVLAILNFDAPGTSATLYAMEKTGVDALPIVGLISFLLGLIMAFMSSVQLRQFGANIYVASLVGLAMVRELGPIMTAIIVAGRSGSAFAAEIGTMKISEEVDALFTMGFDPTRFLVVPKMVATVIVVPFLTMFSDLCAILGGLVVGVSMLDLTVNAYIFQTMKTLTLFDVFWGLLKSGIFALLITIVGCLRGFQVKGGAASVGQATTSAVVSGIFLIILSDSLFAVILRYWG
jgi:phospholipid/cholesterol/gamma-HCH transport system permease protein